MVADYALPEWFPNVFTGGGYTRDFMEQATPLIGRALAESYKSRPELFEQMRAELGEKPSYGYNPNVERFLAPLAAREGKTPGELLFGWERGREGIALSGSVPALAGILLLKDEPLEHLQAFSELQKDQTRSFVVELEWEDAWRWGGEGKKADPFHEWVNRTAGRFEYTALAIRQGYRGEQLKALATYHDVIMRLTIEGVPVAYSVELVTSLVSASSDYFAGFRAHEIVLSCWTDGLAPEYAALVVAGG
jgi:hypothetical protein